MIRLLKESEKQSVLQYLYQDPNFNIFPIGDIETFGLESDFQRVYAEFDENQNFLSIFLRYREHAIYYSHKIYFNKDYTKIFEKDPFQFISAKTENLNLLYKYLPNCVNKPMFFLHANHIDVDIEFDKSMIKKVETKESCSKLYDLLSKIDDFGIKNKSKNDFIESKIKSLEMGVTIYIEEDNKIVSTVATTAETTKNAMVVAVATDEQYRNKGYASMLMIFLMDMYFSHKHKELCLFYDNPSAGKIYKRLGFKDIGTWNMCSIIQK